MIDRRRLGAAAVAALAGAVAFWIAAAPANPPAAAAGTAMTADPSLSPQSASTTYAGAFTSPLAATPSPTPSPTPAPTATPAPATPTADASSSPAPCATPTPAPSSTPVPSPAPSATPGACATPAPSPAASPSPAQIAQGTAGGGPGSAGPAAPASPAAPTPASATVVAGDPLLTAQVQAILANPVAAQRPDLVHFTPPAGGSGGTPSRGGGGGASAAEVRSPAPLALAVAALALVLMAGLLGLALRHRPIGRRLRAALLVLPLDIAAAAGVCAGLLAASGGQVALPAASVVTAAPGAPAGSVLSALRTHTVSLPVGGASRTWSSLVTIESAVVSQHDRVVTDEQQITAITQQLAAAASPSAPPERPAAPAVLQDALQRAVADHETAVTSYNDSLQQEYSFFVATVQSPDVSTELQSVAVHTPPDVQNAIATNLDLVRTQLQQEAAIAAAAAAAQQQAAALGQADTSLAGPAPTFQAPVSGVVTQPFGPTQFALEPPLTYNGVFYPHFHTGLDIAAPLDTPLQAAAAGTVLLATSSLDSQGQLTGYGNYVVISHGGGYLTLYGHMDRLMVTPGETVQQGQVIGLLGSTGSSTGPHVHFEIRKDGVFVDPAPYLAAALAG